MTLSVFPDIKVWLALSYKHHQHHELAQFWYEDLESKGDAALIFCRHTQIGFLRLITTAAVMQHEIKTQRQAWRLYDSFGETGKVHFKDEPASLQPRIWSLSQLTSASPQDGADSYLVAFALEGKLRLVTLDVALHRRGVGSILLRT